MSGKDCKQRRSCCLQPARHLALLWMRALLSAQEKLHILTLAMTLSWQEVPGNLDALSDITVYLGSKLAVPGGTWLRGIMDTAF